MVRGHTELRARLLLLGVHHIADRRRSGDAKIGHEAGVRVRATGNGHLQFVHTVGGGDALWGRHLLEERAGIRVGEYEINFWRERVEAH